MKDNPRAETPEKLAEKFVKFGFDATPCRTIVEAYKNAIDKKDVILICGSLYLYKDFSER